VKCCILPRDASRTNAIGQLYINEETTM